MVEISTPMNINHKSMMLDDGSKPCSRTTLLELLSALQIEHQTVSHEAMFTVAQRKVYVKPILTVVIPKIYLSATRKV